MRFEPFLIPHFISVQMDMAERGQAMNKCAE